MVKSSIAASPRMNSVRRSPTTLGRSNRRLSLRQIADRAEMMSLYEKLIELVPSIPKNRPTSKLEIIQHVIDYIFELQHTLEKQCINNGLINGPEDAVAFFDAIEIKALELTALESVRRKQHRNRLPLSTIII